MAFAISPRRRQHLPLLPLIFHLLFVATIFSLPNPLSATRKLMDLVQEQPLPMKYHHGPLLTGPISLNLIWYGKFKPSQRAVVTDFLTSLSSLTSSAQNQPSVAAWWKTVDKYQSQYLKLKAHVVNGSPSPLRLTLGKQIMDENYSLGKSLKSSQLVHLAARGEPNNAINIVLTASDVAVEGFCTSRCGTHGSYPRGAQARKRGGRFAYIWVGNSEVQCPGHCAWPFHQPIYGPQSPPLVAPNNDVGLDGMVINMAGLVAGTVTNPFGNGYFQGPTDAPLEVGSACSGVYGKGSYPGYAGELLVDPATGSSYNAHGAHGRKYLLPALFDPSTSTCSPLV